MAALCGATGIGRCHGALSALAVSAQMECGATVPQRGGCPSSESKGERSGADTLVFVPRSALGRSLPTWVHAPGRSEMADLLAQVPYPGSWVVTGSDRDYDWIGPRSTLPGLGFVFEAFDRFIPFTRWLRAFRRIIGAGGDNMSGAQDLVLVECGMRIEARGMTLKPVGNNRFVGERNIHGTIHRMELTVTSPTEMEERWTWSISSHEAPPGVIEPEALAKAEAQGIDSLWSSRSASSRRASAEWRSATSASASPRVAPAHPYPPCLYSSASLA